MNLTFWKREILKYEPTIRHLHTNGYACFVLYAPISHFLANLIKACSFFIISGGYQPTPFDVAFDRTFDFLLSDFSSHEFTWPVGSWNLKVRAYGLQNLTRDCPIITYETKPKGAPEMQYFLRACVELPKVELVIERVGILTQVSTFLICPFVV